MVSKIEVKEMKNTTADGVRAVRKALNSGKKRTMYKLMRVLQKNIQDPKVMPILSGYLQSSIGEIFEIEDTGQETSGIVGTRAPYAARQNWENKSKSHFMERGAENSKSEITDILGKEVLI